MYRTVHRRKPIVSSTLAMAVVNMAFSHGNAVLKKFDARSGIRIIHPLSLGHPASIRIAQHGFSVPPYRVLCNRIRLPVRLVGQPVRLTAIEYDFLRELSIRAGRVLTHQHLLQRVWGKTEAETAQAIRTHLMRQRRKLGENADNPKYIFAEPRVGYRMERPDARTPGQE